MTTREEIRKLAENAAAYPDPNHPGGKIWDARTIGLIESAILAGIKLVLERDDLAVMPRTQMLEQMARLRGLAGWLEERGATSNAKMAREILEYFEGGFNDRAMTAQLLKELEEK